VDYLTHEKKHHKHQVDEEAGIVEYCGYALNNISLLGHLISQKYSPFSIQKPQLTCFVAQKQQSAHTTDENEEN
jgi:hypothetical protein